VSASDPLRRPETPDASAATIDADRVAQGREIKTNPCWEDKLRYLGFAPVGVHFSQEPLDRKLYNARLEMIYTAAQ
jgi:hypothetical protein